MHDDFLKQMTAGYLTLLLGAWGVYLCLGDASPGHLREFVSSLAWILTWPLIGIAALALIYFAFFIERRPMRPAAFRAHLDTPPYKALKQLQAESKTEAVQIPEPIKKEEPDPKLEQEKREAEELLERARFHQVKQMRSSQEALEASLDEF